MWDLAAQGFAAMGSEARLKVLKTLIRAGEEGLTVGDQQVDDDEFLEPVRIPFAEAVRMAQAGEILDGKSCVAILLAHAAVEARDR